MSTVITVLYNVHVCSVHKYFFEIAWLVEQIPKPKEDRTSKGYNCYFIIESTKLMALTAFTLKSIEVTKTWVGFLMVLKNLTLS